MIRLDMIRFVNIVLGALGTPLAIRLVQVSLETCRDAKTSSARYSARIFALLAVGILLNLAGNALVCAYLVVSQTSQSLLPSMIQIASMVIFVVGLVAMLIANRKIREEGGQK